MGLHFGVVCVIVLVHAASGVVRYDGYRVLRVQKENEDQEMFLEELMDATGVSEWAAGPDFSDLCVSPDVYHTVTQALTQQNLPYDVTIGNVQSLIDKQRLDKSLPIASAFTHGRKRDSARVSNHIVGKYVDYDEILAWVRNINKFFDTTSEVIELGQSTEGRDIVVLKIGIKTGQQKSAVWIDSGLHSREWVSPASLIYVIYKLFQGIQGEDKEKVDLLRQVDFYIMPMANPDGYQFSIDQNRMWRKNRVELENSTCVGVDLNRNFPYHWAEAGFQSHKPCSEVYAGPEAGSEVETQLLTEQVMKLRKDVKAYLSLHSYMQYWFSRWSYTDESPDDHGDMQELGQEVVHAIYNSTGVLYRAGTAPGLLYKYSGGAADWARGVAGIKYSYGVELRDKGEFAFLLPEKYIEPTGRDLLAAVMVVANRMAELYPPVGAIDNSDKRTVANANALYRLDITHAYCYTAVLATVSLIYGRYNWHLTLNLL